MTNPLRTPSRLARAAAGAGALAAAWGAALALAQVREDPALRTVALLEVEGMINGGSGEYVRTGIEGAAAARHEAVVVRLDTPGGMLETTRDIVKTMLGANVPVIVWVAPAGGRAASAGTFITMAGHVAAMAPATNIGAAHPVMFGPGSGGEPDESDEKKKRRRSQIDVMMEKAENDTVALIQSIARERGRNGAWAEKAVRESASETAEKALELKVIDLIASDLEDLLRRCDGRAIKLGNGQTKTLRTAGARVIRVPMTIRQRLIMALAEPTLLAILFTLGMLGLAAEFYHPGTIVPGALGAFCLILALLASQVLPVNWGAAILIVGGGVLLVAEVYVTAHGLMALGGLVCLLFGGMLLVDPAKSDWWLAPDFRVQWTVLVPTVVTVGGFFGVVVYKIVRTRELPQVAGALGLVGETGVAETAVGPEGGKVFVHGELWNARAKVPLAPRTAIKVVGVDGLVVDVEVVGGGAVVSPTPTGN